MSNRNRNRRRAQDARLTAKVSASTNQPKTRAADSFSNPLARLGFGTPNLLEGTQYPITRMTRDYNTLNSLYRSHWVIRRVIDTIPEDMTRNWITLHTDRPPEDIKKIERAWKRNGLKAKVLHGLKWGRLYGGAVGIIMIRGHENILDEPLDLDDIMPGAFAGLAIVDRWAGAYPSLELIEDINEQDFGLPEYYNVTMEGGDLLKIHHSRIIRFIGRKLPYWEELAETHWGASEVEVVFDELRKRDNVSWNIAQLVFLANLRVLKMKDLGETLAVTNAQAQQDLYNTLQAQNWLQSNMGIYVMNSDDGFETHQYSFSGLNDIYESFMMDVAGACMIPVTKLFGRAPAGLNATGDADMQNYYETIQEAQESTLAPIIEKLHPIICMSEFGEVIDDLDYKFNPIRNPSDKDIADLAAKKTTAVLDAFNAGVISQRIAMTELKQMSATTGMFSNITDEDIEGADESTNHGEDMPGDGDVDYGFGAVPSEKKDRGKLPQSDHASDARPSWLDRWLRRSVRNRR